MRSLAALLLLFAAPARADDVAMPDTAKQTVMEQIGHDPAVERTYQLCPADAFEQQAPFYALFTNPRSTTTLDPATARGYFDKACAIAPEFVACEFAKGHLQAMDPKPR